MSRERRDPGALFHPRSMAVIGASGDTGHIRGRITGQLVDCGYPGRVFLVSARGGEILGRRTYPTISAVPEPVDLALIAIPADAVAGVLEECAGAGVRVNAEGEGVAVVDALMVQEGRTR